MPTINLVYGAHELVVDDFNLTVSEWAAALQDVISLGEDAVPFRNGHPAHWDDAVEAGDRVEFVKVRGIGSYVTHDALVRMVWNDFVPEPNTIHKLASRLQHALYAARMSALVIDGRSVRRHYTLTVRR